eukprot:191593_1
MTTSALLGNINNTGNLPAVNNEFKSNIPDITKLSASDRKELLRQLLELKAKENNTTKINVANSYSLNVNENAENKLSTMIPRYPSKSILLSFILSCIVSAIFSLQPILCLLFQDTHDWYCSNPLLNSTASILEFIFSSLMIISMIIIIYYISFFKNKKRIDNIIYIINNNT